jgi:hypothetical protein
MLNLLSFAKYLEEGTNLGSGELGKPNSKTGEARTDILRKLIQAKKPLELVKGGSIVVGDIEGALAAIDQYEKDGNIFAVLDTKNNSIKISQLKKSSVFGGGSAGAGGGTLQTAIAEAAQCVWCAAMLDLGVATPIDDYSDEVLTKAFKKVDVGKTTLKEILAIDDAWKNSSYLSAQLLIKEGYIKRGMTFHRDSKLMKAIYQAKNEAFKNNDFPKFTDDKWNPGDIWAVSPSFNIKSLNTATVRGLQKSILQHFVDRTCVGISLKKIIKKAKSKELNVELPPDTDDYKVLKAAAKAIKSGRGDIWSSKGGTIQYDDGYLMVKDNSAYGSIKAEIQGKTARGGGVGWGYIKDSAKQTLRIVLPEIKTIARAAKKIAKGDKKESDKMFELMQKVEGTTRKDFDKNIKTKPGDWIHAKLGTLYMIEAVERFGGRKTNRWITKLINYAGSKTEDSSAYVKIYE